MKHSRDIAVMWIGDTHAGNPLASRNLEKLPALLEMYPAIMVCLVGDIFDLHFLRRYPDAYDRTAAERLHALLEKVRKTPEVNVVDLHGNHDCPRPYASLSDLMALPHDRDMVIQARKWLAIHGHRFEYLWRFGEVLSHFMGPRLKYLSPTVLAWRKKLVAATGAFSRLGRLGKMHGVPVVVHGHTHTPGLRVEDGVRVICVPDWLDYPGAGGAVLLDIFGNMWRVDADGKAVEHYEPLTLYVPD